MILSIPARGVQGEAGTGLCSIGRGHRRSDLIDFTGRVSPEDKDGQNRDVEEAVTDGWIERTAKSLGMNEAVRTTGRITAELDHE